MWNRRLAEEAELIHAIPRERITCTGAAKFDAYFELEPSLSREGFLRRVGLDPDRPYLLYLGSSQQVAGDETRLRAGAGRRPAGRSPNLGPGRAGGPHPLNGKVWEQFAHDGIVVFPRGGQRPDLTRHRDDYFNTLSHAAPWWASTPPRSWRRRSPIGRA